jgi:hypothetical protein
VSKKKGTAKGQMYKPIIERIFFAHYKKGMREVRFDRAEIETVAAKLGIVDPSNYGDLIYSFRFRTALPDRIRATAGEGEAWVIRLAGKGRYVFALVLDKPIVANEMMTDIKVPDATPGLVTKYSLDDEQALLAKVRYNRLIDIFTGVSCYSLQNHLRTFVADLGQIETDEIYVGVDSRGAQYVFPVQAKGGKEKLAIVQIEQDIKLCAARFPDLICRAIGAQFAANNVIAIFEFVADESGVRIASEKHYRLVPPVEVTAEDLKTYRESLPKG